MSVKALVKAIVLSSLACTASAVEAPVVKLGGSLNTQVGFVQQKKEFRRVTPNNANSADLNQKAIVNDTKIDINVEGVTQEGLKYGGLIRLNADTSDSKTGSDKKADKTMVYIEGLFGRVDAGSYEGVTNTMKVSAVNIARASGGIDGHAKLWINPYVYDLDSDLDKIKFDQVFISDPYLPIGCSQTTKANGINYYTPKFNGFSFGVSYVPDNETKGTISQAKEVKKTVGASFRNVWEGAVNYENQIDNDLYIKGAFLYQVGKSKETAANKLSSNLNAWELGVLVKYKNFSIAGSYGDWGKSETPEARKNGHKYDGYFWNLGAAYEYQAFGASLTYFQSKKASSSYTFKDGEGSLFHKLSHDKFYNKLEVISLGFDYKVAPGFMPYAEASKFTHKRANVSVNNKGVVYLLGTKLSF